ncbi:Retrovirus-related Pol polyprotein from transposon 17.6, partial [Mucuna pruriens]
MGSDSWRVCIDYRKLNQAIRKDHFPLPFLDQVLEKLAENSHYCFLDGYSGYMLIHIAPEDQHKTTFTYPFGTFAYTRMPFGLHNAPSTFQRCMLSIFLDLLEDCMEVFMDDFTVYVDTFDLCLGNLARVPKRCIETDLMLNFEKCHFMVVEGIVLSHLVSTQGIEVEKAKIDIITYLPNSASVREVRSFLRHASFYKRFIKNFSKTTLPLSKLLQKDVEFVFNKECIQAFEELKTRLTFTAILQAPNWELLFELMDKKGADNAIVDHLSRIEREPDPMPIRDNYPNEQLLCMDTSTPWFADICNFIVASQFPLEASRLYKEKIKSDAKYNIWDDPYLWKHDSDHVIHRCIPDSEISSVLHFYHAATIMDQLRQLERY